MIISHLAPLAVVATPDFTSVPRLRYRRHSLFWPPIFPPSLLRHAALPPAADVSAASQLIARATLRFGGM